MRATGREGRWNRAARRSGGYRKVLFTPARPDAESEPHKCPSDDCVFDRLARAIAAQVETDEPEEVKG